MIQDYLKAGYPALCVLTTGAAQGCTTVRI